MIGSAYARPVNSRADLADAINGAVQAGAIRTAILLSARYRGEIAHQQLLPGGSVGATKRFIRADWRR
jgi:hypothetical protein